MRVQTSSFMKTPVVRAADQRAQDRPEYQAAQGIEQANNAVDGIIMRSQRLAAVADMAELKTGLSAWITEYENKGGDFTALPAELNKEIDNRMKALRNKGGYYAQAVEEEYPLMKERLAAKAQDAVVSRALSQAQESAEKLIAEKSADILTHPQDWSRAADEIEERLKDAFIAPDRKNALIRDARHKIAKGAAVQLAGTDPDGTYKTLRETDLFARDLSISERQDIMRQIVTQAGKTQTDSVVYAALHEKAERGESIAVDLRSAFLFGKISKEDYNALSNLARTVTNDGTAKNRDYLIRALKSASWIKTPELEMAELDAQREAETWFRQNKDADLFDLDNKIVELRYKYRLFQDSNSAMLPEKKRKETVKLYYFAADGSSYKNPTYEGLRTTTQAVFLRKDLSEAQKTQILQALDVEVDNLRNKGANK